MRKSNTLLIILVIVLSLLVILLTGYIVYDKVFEENIKNEIEINDETNTDNWLEQQEENNEDVNIGDDGFNSNIEDDFIVDIDENNKLSSNELQNLEEFINKFENNAFVLMDYANIEDILVETNIEILRYSINASEFSMKATKYESEVIWGGEAIVSTRVSSLDDLKGFIREKTNFEISDAKIKIAFSNYFNEELDLYTYLISDTVFIKRKIIDGYSIDNKIYITLDDNTKVILINDNNKYYFYSCDSNYIF